MWKTLVIFRRPWRILERLSGQNVQMLPRLSSSQACEPRHQLKLSIKILDIFTYLGLQINVWCANMVFPFFREMKSLLLRNLQPKRRVNTFSGKRNNRDAERSNNFTRNLVSFYMSHYFIIPILPLPLQLLPTPSIGAFGGLGVI